MRRLAPLLARLAGRLSRLSGRGGGTALPGVVLLKLRPRAAEELSAGLADGSVVISATNGKTTTARMVRSATDAAGIVSVANTAGSNLLRGVATALLDADPAATLGVFEVDEAALDDVVDQVRPRVIVLMNLYRDQLDRYGELESLVAEWRQLVAGLGDRTILVLDADDPAVAYLGEGRPGVVFFGIDDPDVARAERSHAADSTHCPRCDAPLDYTMVTIAHLGHWRCSSCGLARPRPDVSAERVALRGVEGFDIEIDTPTGPVSAPISLPGLHNAYNATAAVAAGHALGLDRELVGQAIAGTGAAFGRGERVTVGGRELVLLLAKNPAGANENVRTVLTHPGDLHVLALLNDRTADGQDVSWIWDVDYEPLLERLASLTVSGDRAHDLALRFVYGGLAPDRLTVQPDPAAAIDHVVETTPAGATVFVLPTYTAMLDLRAELVSRGVTHSFWEDR